MIRKEQREMKTGWLQFSVVLLAASMGFGVGMFCGSGGGKTHSTTNSGIATPNTEPLNVPPDLRNTGGSATKVFAEQLGDLNMQIKQHPIYARVSKDGRFDISDLNNGDMIASDLFYPIGHGDEKERVRQYSFSCGDEACTCYIARNIEDSTIKSIMFDISRKNKKGKTTKYVYNDSNGDGLWDRFTDSTQSPTMTYVRESAGWSWKEKASETPSPTRPVSKLRTSDNDAPK
jgi:hypothetical protein